MATKIFQNNTFLTDLRPGDKVVEYNRNGYEFVSTVKSINNTRIVVTRPDGSGDYEYYTKSGRPGPYEAMVGGWFLLQYINPDSGTPFDPGPVAANAESLLPDNYYDNK